MTRARACLALLIATVATLTVGAADAAPPPCLTTVGGINVETATIPQLGAAMRSGRLTSVQLVDAYIARINAYDDATKAPPNSIRHIDPNARKHAARLDAERRAGRVRGPLHGVPVLLKDNIGTNDMPTTVGSIALAKNVPKRDAHVTAQLRKAGAVILGKANLAEFANWMSLGMPNGYSSLGGQVLCAYDGSNPSGSSSGSAVAMSLSLAAATIGSETAGSVVAPSSLAGIVGVKPSVGVVSRAGIVPLAPSWDTAGPMTKSVVDAALILQAIAGEDARDPSTKGVAKKLPPGRNYAKHLGPRALKGARIGYDPTPDYFYIPPYRSPVFEQALDDLERLGATLIPVPQMQAGQVGATELTAVPNQFKESLNRYLATEASKKIPVRTLSDIIEYNDRHPDRIPYGQNLLIASDATPGSPELSEAQSSGVIAAATAAMAATFDTNDLDAVVGPGYNFAYHAASSRYSSLVVPAGMDFGVPLGLMFIGRPFSEDKLLAYASAFEPIGRARVPRATAVNKALVSAACNG
jgi:amidase